MKNPSQSNEASPAIWDHKVYLPPNKSKHTPYLPQPDRLVLDLPTLEGWKAELI